MPPPLPGTDTCSSWRTVSLGYADPALYAAKAQLDQEQAANLVKDVLGSKNLMGSAKDASQLIGDLDSLVRLNACDGAGLLRFQENVVLFSKGKQPLLLPGAPPPVTPSALPPGVLADSNYNRLAEDLVADQAKTWVFNRYVPGSTSRVIVSHDPTGRPAKILAKYLFNSPGRDRTQGSVTVSFSDGTPECIYFSDAPNACQTPSRRIVARYSSGGYRDANTSSPDSSPAAAAPVQPPPDRGRSAQPPPATTRRSVNPAALAPAPTTAPAPPAPVPTVEQQLQQRAAERQSRAQKATDCRQQAVKDHPQDRVAMAQEYTSCLQAK